jgi:hypothetical protein
VHSALPGIGSLSICDVQGKIRHSTIASIIGEDRHDDFLFRRLEAETKDVLAADKPFQSRLSRTLVMIPLGRRLTDDQGRFAGIIVATLIPAELRSFFRAVDVGRGGAIWLFHPAGLLLAREPSVEDPMGQSTASNSIFLAAQKSGRSGVLVGRVDAKGPVLISGYRVMLEPPMIAAVSLAEDEVLADWRGEARISVIALAVFGALLLLGVWVLSRQRARAALKRR